MPYGCVPILNTNKKLLPHPLHGRSNTKESLNGLLPWKIISYFPSNFRLGESVSLPASEKNNSRRKQSFLTKYKYFFLEKTKVFSVRK